MSARQRATRLKPPKFVDEARIRAHAGSGGQGCVAFNRTRSMPRGCPEGGDGGQGGAVVCVADRDVQTLLDFARRSVYQAGDGARGGRNARQGARGRTLELRLPPGTRIYDGEEVLGELLNHGQTLQVAVGGVGGIGNRHDGTGGPGARGQQRTLFMELRLCADVGLLGLPNAGKSSLLQAVSAARPKVADYPFTTLHPQLGYVETDPGSGFLLADIPGLIRGAARGVGLGLRFLRHLERNRLLLHIVDASAGSVEVLVGQIRMLEQELAAAEFPALPRYVVLNKADLLEPDAGTALQAALARQLGLDELPRLVSALTGSGCRELCQWVASRLPPAAVSA